MNIIEQIKAALAAVAQGEWTIGSRHGDTVVYSGKEPVFGGSFCDYIEPTEVEYHFIVLAHNLMPALLEAVEALSECEGALFAEVGLDNPQSRVGRIIVRSRAALAKLQGSKS